MRIISLAPSNTEILFALGAGESIIARTAYCDYPKKALSIPKVGDWVNPDINLIRSLDPDIILTSTIVQEGLARRLSEDFNVVHLNPRTLSEVYSSILNIADIVDRSSEGQGLVSTMRSSLRDAKPSSVGSRRPRLYIEEWHSPPFVSGNWVPRLASIAGADYGLANEGEYSKEVNDYQIKTYDPEIIVLSICGIRMSPAVIYKRPQWEEISAVKNRKVYVFDDSLLNRPGPRLIEGCRLIRELVTSFSRTSV